MTERTLPRRDWILLPLTGLLTVLLLAAGVEAIARALFRTSSSTVLTCLVMDNPAKGFSGIPNSVCPEKIGESEAMEYRFNSCGHRAGMECGPKPPGTFRIVLVGSSAAAGLRVPFEHTFAALLPRELGAATGRRIEVYNEAMEWGSPHNVALRFSEALAAQPDIVLWLVTSWDVEFSAMVASSVHPPPAPTHAVTRAAAPPRPLWRRALGFLRNSGARAETKVTEALSHTRTSLMLRHVLYMSQSQNVSHFLDSKGSAFLQSQPGPQWLAHEREFDTWFGNVQSQAAAAGVPLVVTLFPHRAQASLISIGEWPRGFDPYRLGRQVRSIVESHGARYFDLLSAFRRIPNPERYYFPLDGHCTAEGHVVLSNLLTAALVGGPVPELR